MEANERTFEYPNHYEMKRNRIVKLKEAQGKCEVCGEPAFCVHHLDGSLSNHAMDNLTVVCRKCHRILHAGREISNFSEIPKTSKYIRLYDMTLQRMADLYGGSPSTYRKMHVNGTLKDFLEGHENS